MSQPPGERRGDGAGAPLPDRDHHGAPDEAAAAAPGPGLDPLPRRRFLQAMGSSLALVGLGACTRQPREAILPYVRQPEELIPGRPQLYATAMPVAGYAFGVLVESHLGRPTKIEGNPDHPASLGGTDATAQAAIYDLYDPDRSTVVTRGGQIRTWQDLLAVLGVRLERLRSHHGKGLSLLTETVTSPTLAGQIRALLAELPAARWHQWQPAGRDNLRAGARLAFGELVETRHDFTRAARVVALDADFLGRGPGAVRYARDFAKGRGSGSGASERNRLYAVESTPTLTGVMADHRLAARPGAIVGLARALGGALGIAAAAGPGGDGLGEPQRRWVEAVARDLTAHPGASLVVAGDEQPAPLHALVHHLNARLGNLGRTVFTIAPVEAEPVDQLASLQALAEELGRGEVELLLILGGNPAFNAPADLELPARIRRAGLSIHLGLHDDETAALCHWHAPEAHFLESWSDGRAFDGTVSLVQPLIAPLYDGHTAHELLAALGKEGPRTGYDIVRAHWQGEAPADFERFWRQTLHDGVAAGTAAPGQEPALRSPGEIAWPEPTPSAGLDVVFRPDPAIGDGRFANNPWLQELPRPLTRLTWDNAVLLAPATARRLGVTSEEVVAVALGPSRLEAPVWVVPGHAEETLTLHYGNGRRRAGRVGNGAGFDVYRLRRSGALDRAEGATVAGTGRRHLLATTQEHHRMEGRAPARTGDAAGDPHPGGHAPGRGGGAPVEPAAAHGAPASAHLPPSLYPAVAYPGHAWAMTIDLDACTGCGACTLACQAENNIPSVGKAEVRNGREMHWIRVDRYDLGEEDDASAVHQPVACMHCENAPCEVVCPVGATVHGSEGLNEMVYNRCVGTRYCANNCPYKVRRFNFRLYSDFATPVLGLLRNPDVTVRSRGVMEKCTYCVQRINAAGIDARLADRSLGDGDVVPACAQACPARAIVFGDRNDAKSQVARLKTDPRHYDLLAELNTRPRTGYLSRRRNLNPELPAPAGGKP